VAPVVLLQPVVLVLGLVALASLASAVLVQLTLVLLEVAPVVLLQLVVLVLAHLVVVALVAPVPLVSVDLAVPLVLLASAALVVLLVRPLALDLSVPVPLALLDWAALVALVLVHLALPRVVLLAPLALVALVAPLVVFRVVPPAMPLDLDLSAVMQRVTLPGPVPSARVPLAPILPTRVLLGLVFLAAAPLVLAVPDLVRLAQASLAA
jgi:hypothetical protein